MKNILILFIFLWSTKFSFAGILDLPIEVMISIIQEVMNLEGLKARVRSNYNTYDFIKNFNTEVEKSEDGWVSYFGVTSIDEGKVLSIRKRLFDLAQVNKKFISAIFSMISVDRIYEEIFLEVIDSHHIEKLNKKLALDQIQEMSFLLKIYLIGIKLKPGQLEKLIFLHPFIKSVSIIENDNVFLSFLFFISL